MDKMKGWLVGKVFRDPIKIEKASGKIGMELTVCLDQFKLSDGRVFQQRVQVVSYQKNTESLIDDLKPGTRVHVFGDVDAKAEEINNKVYASPRIIGEVELC